ncbi:MAG: O-antigen polymerase [Polaromonas sp.]|nr:O-antigen polymerase [Polaromonas sp.]
MQFSMSLIILVVGAVLAALATSVAMAGAVQLTSRRTHGYLHLIFYAMVFLVAVGTLLSTRDLSIVNLNLEEAPARPRHPILNWMQPLISLMMLAAAGERILSYALRREKTSSAPGALLAGFMTFWLCTVAAPAFFGAHPFVSHDYAYSLILGIAALLVSGADRDIAFKTARNALALFMLASLLLVLVRPSLVLDWSYTQGLLPGIPRLAGLAPHAISLAVFAQLGLICLMAFPYERIWMNRLAWFVGLMVLFLAQSKTAWISFFLCWLCFAGIQKGANLSRRLGDPMRPGVGIASILLLMLAVLATGLVLMFGDLGTRIDVFFNTAEGAQLATLTGRDKIWAIAFEEWRRNPVFGYGPLIWETDFRISIAMPNATHGHNQFMDTLSRSGTVGAAALVAYALVLLFMSVRYGRESKGLTLALFTLLAVRSISEVPLLLLGYSPEFVTHLLLLMALAAASYDVRSRNALPRHRRQYPAAFAKSSAAFNSIGIAKSGA